MADVVHNTLLGTELHPPLGMAVSGQAYPLTLESHTSAYSILMPSGQNAVTVNTIADRINFGNSTDAMVYWFLGGTNITSFEGHVRLGETTEPAGANNFLTMWCYDSGSNEPLIRAKRGAGDVGANVEYQVGMPTPDLVSLAGYDGVPFYDSSQDRFQSATNNTGNRSVLISNAAGEVLFQNQPEVDAGTANEDILVWNNGTSTWERLAIGSEADVLTVSSGAVAWTAPGAGGGATTFAALTDTALVSPAAGHVLYFNGTDWVNLAAGTAGQYLEGGTTPAWTTPPGGSTTLAGLTDTDIVSPDQGSLLYWNGTDWAGLGAGTAGQYLEGGTTPAWTTVGSLTLAGLTDTDIVSPDQGGLLYWNSADWADLAAGATTQVLRGGTTPSWVNFSLGSLTDTTINTPPATGGILYYNGGAWVDLGAGTAGQYLEGGATPAWTTPAGGGSSTLAGLTDTSVGTPNAGELLYFDGAVWTTISAGTSAQYLAGGAAPAWATPTLAALDDTSIVSPVQGGVLYYSGTDWVNLGAGAPGQYLEGGTTPAWTAPPTGGGVTTFAALNDTDIVSPNQGGLLYWNSTDWANLAAGTATQVLTGGTTPSWSSYTLAALDDLSIASPTAGSVLYFSGTDWVNLAAGTAGQFLQGGTTPSWAAPSALNYMLSTTYDPAGIAQQVVGTTATQTLTNKTLSLTDNAANNFVVQGANSVISANLTNGSEVLTFGHSADASAFTHVFIGSGGVEFNAGGAGSFYIDKTAGQAGDIGFYTTGNQQGVNLLTDGLLSHIEITTTGATSDITIDSGRAVSFSATTDLNMTAGDNMVWTLDDNNGVALRVTTPTANDYILQAATTTGAPALSFGNSGVRAFDFNFLGAGDLALPSGALLDGSGSAGTAGYILSTTGTSTAWIENTGGGGGGGATVLNDLTDVNATAAAGHVLQHNGTQWTSIANKVSVGNGSPFSVGNYAGAIGTNSLGVGYGSLFSVSGVQQTCVGFNARASGSDCSMLGASITGSSFTSFIGAVSTLQSSSIGYGMGRSIDLSNCTNAGGFGYNVNGNSYDNLLLFGRNATATQNNEIMFGGDGYPLSRMCLGSGNTDATPESYVEIRSTSGVGTNISASDILIKPGASTGNAVPAEFAVQTTDVGTSGTTAQTYRTRFGVTADPVTNVPMIYINSNVGGTGAPAYIYTAEDDIAGAASTVTVLTMDMPPTSASFVLEVLVTARSDYADRRVYAAKWLISGHYVASWFFSSVEQEIYNPGDGDWTLAAVDAGSGQLAIDFTTDSTMGAGNTTSVAMLVTRLATV